MDDNNKVELELTDYMLTKFKDTFDIELDLLNGSVRKMSDGRWHCIIHVSDEKIRMFKDFFRMMASLPATDKIKISIAGVQINNN